MKWISLCRIAAALSLTVPLAFPQNGSPGGHPVRQLSLKEAVQLALSQNRYAANCPAQGN